jgi:LysR family transcriptional regulator, glycine cleavage system transcriptional activator
MAEPLDLSRREAYDLANAERRERLPSLRALKAFEVVGRHLNMQQAAEELCITVSAVSHQIRNLESELGVQLFHRTGRGLELTRHGAALFPSISTTFDQLATVIDQFRRQVGPDIVTVSMSASFAMRWFVPHLAKLHERHPNLEVRIATHSGREVQKNFQVDCFIHLGERDEPGLDGELLFSERLSVACSPILLSRTELTAIAPDDVLRFRLLKSEDRPEDWALWYERFGLKRLPTQRTLLFESRNLAIQAAIEGLGVILAEPVELERELETGRLVQPFGPNFTITTKAYYFVTSMGARSSTPVAQLREWLFDELVSQNR